MRALFVAALLALTPALALGDVGPNPGRPDFDDTPLPMPDPLEAAALGLVLLGGAAIAMSRRKRT